MKPILDLKTALEEMRQADSWSWYRGDFRHSRGSLTIWRDNIPADRRSVVRIRFWKTGEVDCEETRIRGWDPVKQNWSEEIDRKRTRFENRKGEKALREYIRECAIRETGFPNPEFVFVYPLMPA